MTLKYEHLIGLKFEFGEQDCLTLIRSFYADNFNIFIPNYARPNNFWEHKMEMYYDRCHKNGFRPLDCHPSEYQVGDLVIMNIRSSVGNHAGVLVEKGKLLHHLWGGLSKVDQYVGPWRNSTTGVMRHKDIVLPKTESTMDIMDTLSPHTRRKIDAAIARLQEAG